MGHDQSGQNGGLEDTKDAVLQIDGAISELKKRKAGDKSKDDVNEQSRKSYCKATFSETQIP